MMGRAPRAPRAAIFLAAPLLFSQIQNLRPSPSSSPTRTSSASGGRPAALCPPALRSAPSSLPRRPWPSSLPRDSSPVWSFGTASWRCRTLSTAPAGPRRRARPRVDYLADVLGLLDQGRFGDRAVVHVGGRHGVEGVQVRFLLLERLSLVPLLRFIVIALLVVVSAPSFGILVPSPAQPPPQERAHVRPLLRIHQPPRVPDLSGPRRPSGPMDEQLRLCPYPSSSSSPSFLSSSCLAPPSSSPPSRSRATRPSADAAARPPGPRSGK
mmetsp:Transcript_29391/g.54535  ORF Transcript_29391/g.54535 Transcript_29391/m.54535 type:complete len:268 (+) Transcript_29391:279-1082(+)